VYAWKSAPTISAIIIGFALLVAFGFWEVFAPLKEPLIPIHLFNNFGWLAVCINLGLGASVYYGMAIIWPQMVAVLYTNDGGASQYAGWLNSIVGVMIVLGQLFAGGLAVVLGKTKIQGVVVLTCGAALLGAVASCGPDDKIRAAVLLSLGCFCIGWNEAICLTNAGVEVEDQREIGTAIGFAGSLRACISTIAQTAYVVTLTNRLQTTIPNTVPAALVKAGLPVTSVVGFLTGISTGNFTGVDGLTPAISTAGVRAYKEASAQAYSTVFLVTLAFSGIAVVLSFFTPNVDDKMNNQVAATLHQRGNEELVAEKNQHEVQV
jgi:Fungal trichothecene efflux pump (TRI12)